ncbi:glycosyltransferase family 2 protein [Rubrivirga sp.]|uniref:glycosyltransferase family 2 protein n=1 Tax=Rubrivirga sp. TaxID=1885344 RepID=UPI003B51BACD
MTSSPSGPATSAPTLSVIVPTYARPERLAACLDALARQEPPAGGLEVVVVDDGSPTPAASVAAPFEGRLDLTVLRQPNAGPAVARNTGAARARGALLAFTDDDCQPEPGWARALVEAAQRHPDHLLVGETVNALPQNPFATASQLLISYLYDYFGPESGRALFVASNNMALPAESFRAMGGFDATFGLAAGEDRDFAVRWHEAGRPAALVPGAVVQHAHEMGLLGFWRQHTHYGRGAAHYHDLRGERGVGDQGVEPLGFYAGLVAYPLRESVAPKAWLHAGLLGLAQVANALGYAAARRGRAPKRVRPSTRRRF